MSPRQADASATLNGQVSAYFSIKIASAESDSRIVPATWTITKPPPRTAP